MQPQGHWWNPAACRSCALISVLAHSPLAPKLSASAWHSPNSSCWTVRTAAAADSDSCLCADPAPPTLALAIPPLSGAVLPPGWVRSSKPHWYSASSPSAATNGGGTLACTPDTRCRYCSSQRTATAAASSGSLLAGNRAVPATVRNCVCSHPHVGDGGASRGARTVIAIQSGASGISSECAACVLPIAAATREVALAAEPPKPVMPVAVCPVSSSRTASERSSKPRSKDCMPLVATTTVLASSCKSTAAVSRTSACASSRQLAVSEPALPRTGRGKGAPCDTGEELGPGAHGTQESAGTHQLILQEGASGVAEHAEECSPVDLSLEWSYQVHPRGTWQ